MTDILFEYEDMMLKELEDLINSHKAGAPFSVEDICNGEKILKSIEHIERVVMLDGVETDDYEQKNSRNNYGNYGNYGYSNGGNSNGYGNRSSRGGYSNRRSGHDVSGFREAIVSRMNMARSDAERNTLGSLLSEFDNYQH